MLAAVAPRQMQSGSSRKRAPCHSPGGRNRQVDYGKHVILKALQGELKIGLHNA